MKRGDVWHEQKGRRPVLIVSPEVFNRVAKLPVIPPITCGGNWRGPRIRPV
jgi:mRNA interferase ChpB